MKGVYLYLIGPAAGAVFYLLSPLIYSAYKSSIALVQTGIEIGAIGSKAFILLAVYGLFVTLCGFIFASWNKRVSKIIENWFDE